MSLSKACPKCGSENSVKNGRLHGRQRKYAISHLQTPPLLLALAPPPARLPIDPLFPGLLRLTICFVRHRLWYLLPIVPTPKPGIQFLVRNRQTQLSPTPRHRLPYRPKLPPPSSALAPASISLALLPNLYLPTSSILPASYHFTHRYAHALRPPSLSPASIAPLAAAPTAPAISWLSEHLPLACKALLLDAFKLSSMAVPYLISFGGA
jgi:hypothetical protein